MDQQKTIRTAVALLGLLLLFTISCKKLDKKNPIEFTIKAHIPYSGEPISGVKYTIREYKHKQELVFGDKEYTDFTVEGTTDASGLAIISFLPKKNMNFRYDITFDYSNIQFQNNPGSYSLIGAPTYNIITRKDQPNFEIRALPHCEMHFKIENVNCLDANDKMRYKVFNLDEFPNQSFEFVNIWSNDFLGCGLFGEIVGNNILSGRQIYQIEVTRNDVVTTYIDTFFLQPGIMNEVFLEY